MKRFVSSGFLTLALAFTAAQAHAATAFVTFDEFGTGTEKLGAATNVLPSGFFVDPSGGVPGLVLAYQLPFVVTPGDVQLDELVGAAVVLSDVVRFFNTGGLSFIIFYSDNSDGIQEPADISGLPQNVSPNVVSILEVGPEGLNGVVYTPLAGQPGFFSTDIQPQYNVISDSPEPGSMLLLAAGLAGLGLLKRR
jgi:hypothetical protein